VPLIQATKKFKVLKTSRVLVAPAYNPSYSGGRDQEDRNSKSVPANISRDPISEKNHNRKGLVEWLKVREFKPQYHKKKKKKS
jgi:hypothetical protein